MNFESKLVQSTCPISRPTASSNEADDSFSSVEALNHAISSKSFSLEEMSAWRSLSITFSPKCWTRDTFSVEIFFFSRMYSAMPKLSDSCRIVFATHRQAVKSRVFRLKNAKKPLNIGDEVVFHFVKILSASCCSSRPCYRLLLLRTSSAYAPCMFMHLRTYNLSYSLACYIWRHCLK